MANIMKNISNYLLDDEELYEDYGFNNYTPKKQKFTGLKHKFDDEQVKDPMYFSKKNK